MPRKGVFEAPFLIWKVHTPSFSLEALSVSNYLNMGVRIPAAILGGCLFAVHRGQPRISSDEPFLLSAFRSRNG